ncbi:MAG TPA: FtsX-like permease family protein [Cyclobacteriaceae bacterium]|nr:FtsX-like permease family protein [Cyclobacteriaceae bacterium]
MYLTLAWRNVWRNKRRSLITIISITFAIVLACFMRSMQLGSYARMIDNSVRFYTGHIQLHKKGYWEDRIIDNSMAYDSSLIRRLSGVEGVEILVPRLESFALASFQNKTKGILVLGVDPDKEDSLTSIHDKLVSGKYLAHDDEGVLIAQGLADYLGIQAGDTLTLLSQGYHGANAAGLFPVRGIVKFPLPEQNNRTLYMSLTKAQWFYAAPDLITSISLLIDDPDKTHSLVQEIKTMTDRETIEVMGWRELSPDLVQGIELDNISGKVMLWILYMVIGFGMFGTYLMMTAERRYEFGVVVALGMRRLRLQALVFLEILLMTIIGVISGVLLSLPLLIYFYYHPIRYGEEAAKAIESFGVEAVYLFSLDVTIFTNQAYAIFFMALLLSAYPLWVIQKMKVVESMRP